MFDLQIDKKKENKKMSSMNKSCEKKQQQHIVKIFYMWMFCITLKGRNDLCRIGIHQVTFDRMVMILYRTYNSFSLFAMQLNYCNIQRVFDQKLELSLLK
jgi:hypothetical protein